MVPNGWNKQTVGDLCDFINGNGFKSSEWSDKGLPIIRIQNLNGSNNFNYYEGAVLEKWIVNQGDILFAWAGSKGVSFGAKYWDGPKGLLNQHIFRVEPKAHVDKKWLFWVLLKVTQRVENMAHGFKATLLHVQKADITEQVILVPSLAEQQRIAQILSTWDQAISATEKMLENSQQQKKALMQQLLTGKKRLLDENGERFSEKWKIFCLADIAEMNSGGTPKSSVAEYYDGGIPWVSIADMTNHGKWISTTERTLTSLGVENSSARLYPKNTILYAMYASIGECSIAKVEVSSSQAILGIRPKDCLHYEFLYFYLCSLKDRIKLQGQQGTQSNLNAGMVKDFKINLPNLKEQQAIANVLNICDEEILVLQKKLDCLKQEKKALMQQLLTGKKRVKVAA